MVPAEAGGAGDLVDPAARPAARHRLICDRFTLTVLGVRDWTAATPVPEWLARDVVAHLIEWFPPFLRSGGGPDLATTLADNGRTDPASDPVAAWLAQSAAVQRVLDDPDSLSRPFDNPHVGTLPLAQAVDRFYTTDVFLHTWDLARATGQHDRLDPDWCADLLAGMEPMEAVLRASGHYGRRVAVDAAADDQQRLLAFIGRDPAWRPPG